MEATEALKIKPNLIITMETTLIKATPIIPLTQPVEDVYSSLLASKHKVSTRNTYRLNLKYFTHYLLNGLSHKGIRIYLSEDKVKAVLAEVLSWDKFTAIAYLSQYQTALIEAGYTPNTINLRVASIRAFVKFAHKRGLCDWLVDDLTVLGNEVYRDTTGVSSNLFSTIISDIAHDTISGKRDYAIMRLLWDNGLRRGEISSLNVEDFNPADSTLAILGKGRLSKEIIHLSPKTSEAIKQWLLVRKYSDPKQPLFISLAYNTRGNRLTGKSIYCTVRKYSDPVLADKILSPHRVRHSSITAVLDASNGNVRLAQKFSRHKCLDTLNRYDDNRKALQKEAVNLLAEMI
ncbi:tyrosine-type recombinase/integrase (plasmid) [Cyanobacterium sp. IPPAS B-1200]|uniref:tyrosine-type recombinase/integrase n=1 Tax=Cyanobacterium sp. IPPAS B-1200 TaxID=1562720 RepID=UPI00086EF7BC|nr:tyrosine-type recombinase/integrase [Cyanobacterium sp. IPPAS B-1200]OEJ78059.1 hypothetical protein A5482_14465 [Cyanobacterium sp. IPPAS B-1200]